MVDRELLELLACPETRQKLREAPKELLERLNARIARGELTNVGGAIVREPVESGLLREDGRRLYPVLDGIPMLIRDEGLSVDGTG